MLVVTVIVWLAIAVLLFATQAGAFTHWAAKVRVQDETTPVPTVSVPAISVPLIEGVVPQEETVGTVPVATRCEFLNWTRDEIPAVEVG